MSDKRKRNWVYALYATRPAGFRQGVIDGLGSFGQIWEAKKSGRLTRRFRSKGLRGDWEEIGKDLTSAMHKADECA